MLQLIRFAGFFILNLLVGDALLLVGDAFLHGGVPCGGWLTGWWLVGGWLVVDD